MITRKPCSILSIALVWTLACTYENDNPSFRPAQPLTGFNLVRTSPSAGQVDVPINTTVDLCFDVAPLADSAIAAHVRIFSGLIESRGKLKVDLIQRRIRFTPIDPLQIKTRYRVFLHQDLMGITGVSLKQHQVFEFTTGSVTRNSPKPAPPSYPASEVQMIWQQTGCLTCHHSPSPPAGVDLSTVTAMLGSLSKMPQGSHRWPRVLPFDHARSYLMLKLIGQGSFVGFPMPPGEARLPRSELEIVADWIDSGAAE